MSSIAYKWRLSTNKYAYITSSEYKDNGSDPNYELSFISYGPNDKEEIIKEKVRLMSADEYRLCFENMIEKISKDEDGQYIKFKNWAYYYHFIDEENNDNKILFVDATASAKLSQDENAYASVSNTNGMLNFLFEIPRGKDGKDGADGKDGLDGVPVNDGKYNESIYLLTKNDNYEGYYYPDTWYSDISYQNNDFIPKNWTDRPSGITVEHKYEWVSTRKYDLDKKEWGKFSTPAKMSRWGEDGKDGDGIEYVYKKTKDETKPLPPSTPDDWEDENSLYQKNDEYAGFIINEGWTDVPSKLEKDSYKFEWVSVRKQKNGIWQPFSEPALWSNWGKDGDDVEYIYFLNNDNETPLFDEYDINSSEYQEKEYYPTTNGEKWTDDYQSPLYEKRFSWISYRKRINGIWGEFSKPTLFNTYKIGGKSFVDLYARSNFRLSGQDLPHYSGNIYYSFLTDKYYSDSDMINEITGISSNTNVLWNTDIPADNTAKMLFKTSALVEIKDNLDEIITIPENLWYGPYLVSTNGENAISIAPYVVFDDDSLSIPIKQDTKTPHEAYEYSFNANLYYGDNIANINECIITTSNDNKIINISNEKNEDNRKVNIKFNINNSFEFTTIELVYVTLKGEYEGKTIEALGQFKIIPFISEDAILYKILLNQDAIFVPGEPCTNENGVGIWETTLEVKVVDNKGNEINVPNTDDNRIVYESKNGELIKIENGGLKLIGCVEKENENQLVISELPNPLKIIYQVNGKTREIEYVNFTNMPLNGVDGISSRLVFAYCSLNEGETPYAPTGGTVNFETNEIETYPEGKYVDSNGQEQNITWGDINNLNGVVWLSQCEYFNDGTQDLTWTNPVRISGAKGENPYHVELSNDMDQFYVTDDIIVYEQSLTTIISLFNGDEKVSLDNNDVSITDETGNFIINLKNISDTDVEVKITSSTGVKIEKKTVDFVITIDGHAYDKNYNFTKTFKTKILNGTKDYDLDITPTFIKKNKNGVYSTSEILVNITERDIATNSKVINKLELLPDNIYFEYYYNNDNENVIKINNGEPLGYKIPVEGVNEYQNNVEKVTINLYKDNTNIDQAIVECVSDGVDGSAYHLELSNEFDQVYTINNKILPGQTGITTTVQLFNGTQAENIGNLSVNNFDGISTTGITGNTLNISFNENAEVTEKEYIYKVSGTTLEGDVIEKDFKIIVLNGTKDYDLHSTHTYVKKYGDNLLDSSITITVLESIIGTNDRTKTTLDELPSELEIKIRVDGENYNYTNHYDNGLKINLKEINLEQNIEVDLYRNGVRVDFINIEVIKDGKDGVSPYYIDLSNDFDQVLTTNNTVIHPQTITTVLSVYCGENVIEASASDIICDYNDELFTLSALTGNGEKLIYQITPKIDSVLEQNKTYDFNFVVGTNTTNLNYEISKKFKIIALNGTKDYDLNVTPTIIKKTKIGYNNSAVTIYVKETDISRTDRHINKLRSLEEYGLTVECYKEGVDKLDVEYNENGIEILPTNFPEKFLYIKLLSGETLIDESYVEIVSDGNDGEDGKDGTNIEFIYKLYTNESEFNTDNANFNENLSKDELLDKGWTDSPQGISKENQIEACTQRVKEAGENDFSPWVAPFIWAKWGDDGIDGDGVEYIFQITDRDNKPLNPGVVINDKLEEYSGETLSALTEIINTYDFFPGEKWIENNTETINAICAKLGLNANDFINDIVNILDLNWTDDPMDVGPYEPLEWVSIRRKKVNLDGTFEYEYTDPTIWAEWKRDTYDSVTEFMFAIDSRDLSICRVSGGTWKDIKDGTVYSSVTTSVFENVKWNDSVPNHNALVQNVWMVKGFASGEIIYTGGTIDGNTGITYSEINWTSPTKLIDSQLMQVEYSCDTSGKIPSPVNLNVVSNSLGENYTLPDLELAFRELDKETNGHDFEWVDVPESGNTPTWMITSTFQNNTWSDWVVSKIKGEQGPQGETGQSIQVKGSFDNLDQLKDAYSYYLTQSGEQPSKYFNDDKLTIGDSYIVNEAKVNGETVYGYLFVYVKEDDNFEEAWEGVGQIKGDSSYIYIIYADSVNTNANGSKTYTLTNGGTDDNGTYYGTTPGKYIGIHIATQQYEGHPYPPKLYSASTITDTDKTFLWNKWSGDDGFGQEQIFILGNETAPNVPKFENYSANTTIEEWNGSDYVPDEWSDVPLTPTIENRYCWMVTRRFPSDENPNNFKGDTNDKAILFTYLSEDGKDGADGKDGVSSYHVELSNDFDLISTLNGKVNGQQTFMSNITLYEGDTPKTITSIAIENNNGWEFETGKTEDNIYYVKNIFANGESFTDPINPVIKVNGKYNGYVTIKPIEGVALYQLESNVGFVVEGKPTDITVSVKQKTNEGLIDVTDLPDGMGIYVYLDNATSAYTSGTSYSLTYNYDGDSSINEIDFRLVKNGTVYDNINIEVKNDIKAFGSLNLNPLEKVVYVNDDNKPMVSSITFDASFIYEGEQIDLTDVNVIVPNSKTTDFQDTVDKTTSSITVNYKNDVSIQNLTKEKYILETTYNGDTYQNEFYIIYIRHYFEISSDSDTIYVPENTNSTISRELGINVIRSGANITNDVELKSEGDTSSVTFNQRNGVWYANIPSDICGNVEITQLPVIVSYSGLSDSIEYTIIRGGKNDEYWYINAFPKYLFTGSTIELYLTKNSYDGDYISLESAKSNNVNLYYIIDGGEEINYTSQLENVPKLHGNNVFYSDGYITGTTENDEFKPLYTQEPVYTSIEFRLYDENNNMKKLLSSEIVERYDILKNSEIKKINAHGLIINATDIFEEYNSNDYDIVIKAVK